MIHEADLRELVEFDGQEHPVLSLYLNVDSRTVTIEQYKLTLRSLFSEVSGVNSADKERIEHYLDLEYDRQARGIACFSCQEQDFWRVFTFNVPVDNAIMVERRPLVRRLVDLIDTFGNIGVVAVDKLGARFFSFHMGTLEEASGTVGDDVKHHKQGGWAAARYQRHEDEAAMSNLRVVAELTEQYARQYNWRRLVLAGTDENISRFADMLSPATKRLVAGSTPLEINAGIQDVRERAEAVAFSARQDHIRQLAEDLVAAAAKEAGAVADLAPTLEALQNGSVYRLLVAEDYVVAEGRVQRCAACNYLSVESGDACPLCGGENQPLPDAVNTIARRAITQGAEVIVLPAENPLSGGIGAYLRY